MIVAYTPDGPDLDAAGFTQDRLRDRLGLLVEQFEDHLGGSLPQACQGIEQDGPHRIPAFGLERGVQPGDGGRITALTQPAGRSASGTAAQQERGQGLLQVRRP